MTEHQQQIADRVDLVETLRSNLDEAQADGAEHRAEELAERLRAAEADLKRVRGH